MATALWSCSGGADIQVLRRRFLGCSVGGAHRGVVCFVGPCDDMGEILLRDCGRIASRICEQPPTRIAEDKGNSHACDVATEVVERRGYRRLEREPCREAI